MRTIEEVRQEVERKIKYYREMQDECYEAGDHEGAIKYREIKWRYLNLMDYILGIVDEIELA